MSLQTYLVTSDEGPSRWPIAPLDGEGKAITVEPSHVFSPGSTVTHVTDGGYGTVVASSWYQVVVLWSAVPVSPLRGWTYTSSSGRTVNLEQAMWAMRFYSRTNRSP